MKKIFWATIATVAFVYLLGVVGSYDLADEVVYTMNDEVYEAITEKIGKASNKEVAAEYFSNRQYYDSIR